MNRITTSLAKITRPNFSGALPRQRLFSQLDRSRDYPIIWVTGPPGSGKTTLVSNYLDNRQLDCLWYQVDQGETDIATFFYYMRQSALKGEPTNEASLPLYGDAKSIADYTSRYIHDLIDRFTSRKNSLDDEFSSPNHEEKKIFPKFSSVYTDDIAAFTKSYFRHLFGHLKIPFIVVLDSYNEVPAHSEFHEIIRYGLSEIPSGGCVIFISRSEPPAAMARFRASQNMQLINWDDLRLTRHESDSIVKLRGHELSEDVLLQVYEKTQGWAAGLVLMLENFRTEGKMSRPPETFTPQVIFDYLAGEIFQKFDKQTKEFLLQTAYVPQMTAAMAEEITGFRTAGSLLDELSRHHNFVTAKQTINKTVYQYHPLFREFLLSIVKDTLKDKGSDKQYHKIAALLESNGQIENAMEFLVEAKAWDQLVEVLQRHASEILESGRGETLAQWLEDLPEEISDENPWILYWLASCRFPFALRESRRLYEHAYALFKNQNGDVKGLMLACSGVIDTILHELDDLALLDQWISRLNELWRSNTDTFSEDIEARVSSCLFMAMVLRQPDNPDIEYWVDRAYSASLKSSNPNQKMSVQTFVAISYMWAGYFLKAKEIIDSMKKLTASPDISPSTLIMLKNAESMYFMLTGNHNKCLKAMHQGLKIAQTTGVTLWNYQLIINGIGGSLISGDMDTANQLLKEIESGRNKGRRQEKCLFHYFSAWNAILGNEKLHAYQHQKNALRLSIEAGNPFFEILCRLAIAQILFELGDERKGAVHLRKARHTARNIKNHLLEFISFLSYAHIAIDHGRKRSGLNSLQYAMQLGREYGYRHTLWWRPEVMAKLCAVALQEGIETEYVHNLIRERNLLPHTSMVAIEQWPWLFKIYTFGQCKLLKDDASIGLVAKLQRKPMELLKAIIAFGGDDVNEDNLAKTLWPGVDSDYSYRSLTINIHRLRKLLGIDSAIVVQDGRISLDKRYCWLDIWAFDKTVEELDSLLKKSMEYSFDAEKIMNLTNKIMQLYRDPFMARENEKPWFIPIREQLRNKFIRCMSDIAHLWEERGNIEKAVECYQKSLESDNLAEGFYRRLMLCYHKLGRQAEAIEVYERCRKTFLAVLKAEPSTETTTIYENIMHDMQ